jgi:threonine aldolase
MSAPIDLRSDTVTRPTRPMRHAMATAEVGDDVYAEDPTARRLEERAAELLGKEKALFVPSGTMANQIAIALHTRPGDEVIIGEGAHSYFYESGAAPALWGVQFAVAGKGGLFTAAEAEAAIRPAAYYMPRTSLVAIENTHNWGGGIVFPQDDVLAIAKLARTRGLAVHLDGARIWNAAVATGRSAAELAAPFDTASACFSKGLGAPVGSVLAGSAADMERARRLRKMLGGGMRQVGILAAAALHALEHHRERLAEDHANARALAEGLAEIPGVTVDLARVQTNIVMFESPRPATEVVARALERGVLLHAFGPTRVRAVTHLDLDRAAVDRALVEIRAALE